MKTLKLEIKPDLKTYQPNLKDINQASKLQIDSAPYNKTEPKTNMY